MPSDPTTPTDQDRRLLHDLVGFSSTPGITALARAVLYLLHRDQERPKPHDEECICSRCYPSNYRGGAAGGEGEEGSTLDDDVLRGALDCVHAYGWDTDEVVTHLEVGGYSIVKSADLERERAAHEALRTGVQTEVEYLWSLYINTAARNAARRLSRLLDPPDPDPKAD